MPWGESHLYGACVTLPLSLWKIRRESGEGLSGRRKVICYSGERQETFSVRYLFAISVCDLCRSFSGEGGGEQGTGKLAIVGKLSVMPSR